MTELTAAQVHRTAMAQIQDEDFKCLTSKQFKKIFKKIRYSLSASLALMSYWKRIAQGLDALRSVFSAGTNLAAPVPKSGFRRVGTATQATRAKRKVAANSKIFQTNSCMLQIFLIKCGGPVSILKMYHMLLLMRSRWDHDEYYDPENLKGIATAWDDSRTVFF